MRRIGDGCDQSRVVDPSLCPVREARSPRATSGSCVLPLSGKEPRPAPTCPPADESLSCPSGRSEGRSPSGAHPKPRDIDGLERADALDAETKRGEKKSGNIPQLIPSLRLLTKPACDGREEVAITERGPAERSARTRVVSVDAAWRDASRRDVIPCVAHQAALRGRARRPRSRSRDRNGCGRRPYRAAMYPVRKAVRADRQVAGAFVEADGKAAGFRSNEVHLHDDGHGPRKTLVDAEQCVRRHHPAPGRGPSRS